MNQLNSTEFDSTQLKSIELQKRKYFKIGLGLRDGYWLSRLIKLLPIPYLAKVHLNATTKPSYAFGLYSACFQAKMLGLKSVCAIEFGVAGGKGLRALEYHAEKLEQIFDLKIRTVGFDIGSGLVDTKDIRDMVYWFAPGIFKVDTEKVRKSLKRSEFIIGNISETINDFISSIKEPIGFVSLDFDHYTATKEALKVLQGKPETRLPRVICYLDDIFGISDLTLPCSEVGEELAIKEFNSESKNRGIYKIAGLRHKRAIPSYWNDQMYAFHDFDHPLYNKMVNPL